MTIPHRIWIYEAHAQISQRHPDGVVDGDTMIVNIDQGMNHWAMGQYIRFAGINAPEISTDEGKTAKAFLQTIVDGIDPLYLATVEYNEFEKYGRVLAVIFTAPPTQFNWADAVLTDLLPGSVNQAMIDSGNAVSYLG